ncbi:copper resistance protein B [Brevundimonas abyssalis TAR-001]|uniref:Copper resistance protein B n=1 Tax=Brevundimonas abyssalis TAR-001 TaxID=1391729 RepID=A0A8E0NAT4_9CAUL|nr:copper resistance protein B [Brevundimonas abyssalis TAR-001]
MAATSGPTHAADLLFDPAEMAASREQLRIENGEVRASSVIIDQLEASFSDGEEAYGFDVQGWTGGDINRFWWKSEGEGEFDGGLEEAELQALYSRAIRPFFDFKPECARLIAPTEATGLIWSSVSRGWHPIGSKSMQPPSCPPRAS